MKLCQPAAVRHGFGRYAVFWETVESQFAGPRVRQPATVRAGVHRIYLPAPVDAQAWTEVQTRLSLRLQPYPVGTLHRHAMEVLAGAQDSRWEG